MRLGNKLVKNTSIISHSASMSYTPFRRPLQGRERSAREGLEHEGAGKALVRSIDAVVVLDLAFGRPGELSRLPSSRYDTDRAYKLNLRGVDRTFLTDT